MSLSPFSSEPFGKQTNGVQTALDLAGAAYDDLENGTIIDGYMLVAHTHDTSNAFRGQVWALVTARVGWVERSGTHHFFLHKRFFPVIT